MNPLQFYKPNKSNTGHAASFSVDKGNLYCSMIKQFSWDDYKKTGSFIGNKDDASKNVATKLSVAEAGSIINVVKNCTKFTVFHSSKDQTLNISFQPWIDKNGELLGFGFMVDKKSKTDSTAGNKFNLTLTLGESEVLSAYLLEYLRSTFLESKDSQGSQNQQAKKPYNKTPNQAPKPRSGGYSGYGRYGQNNFENQSSEANIEEGPDDSEMNYQNLDGASEVEDDW